MSTLVKGIAAFGNDLRTRGLTMFVWCLIIALTIASIANFMLPPAQDWFEWHSVEAYYDHDNHMVVIDSRSWNLHKPCPREEVFARDALITDVNRRLHVFSTLVYQPYREEPGRHSAGPLRIPLRDLEGRPLLIEPHSVQLLALCGSRPAARSPEVVLQQR